MHMQEDITAQKHAASTGGTADTRRPSHHADCTNVGGCEGYKPPKTRAPVHAGGKAPRRRGRPRHISICAQPWEEWRGSGCSARAATRHRTGHDTCIGAEAGLDAPTAATHTIAGHAVG